MIDKGKVDIVPQVKKWYFGQREKDNFIIARRKIAAATFDFISKAKQIITKTL